MSARRSGLYVLVGGCAAIALALLGAGVLIGWWLL